MFVLSNIDSLLINGHRLILDQVYDSIGFNQIDDEILRSLVIARVSQPMSKRATVEYLKSYFDEDVELHNIYRYMDKLYNTQREEVQRIPFTNVKDTTIFVSKLFSCNSFLMTHIQGVPLLYFN